MITKHTINLRKSYRLYENPSVRGSVTGTVTGAVTVTASSLNNARYFNRSQIINRENHVQLR